MLILAIDPGNVESGVVVLDDILYPVTFGKMDNEEALNFIVRFAADNAGKIGVVIEMISHYGTGMAVGETVFDTCIFIGRIIQAISPCPYTLIKRATVKAHICNSAKASDSNVTQALIDRFAKGVRNHGKGVKKHPGWFYGFSEDVWQAYALGVTYADKHPVNDASAPGAPNTPPRG